MAATFGRMNIGFAVRLLLRRRQLPRTSHRRRHLPHTRRRRRPRPRPRRCRHLPRTRCRRLRRRPSTRLPCTRPWAARRTRAEQARAACLRRPLWTARTLASATNCCTFGASIAPLTARVATRRTLVGASASEPHAPRAALLSQKAMAPSVPSASASALACFPGYLATRA